MKEKLLLTRRNTGKRGEDGYKTFSIRINEDTVTELEKIAEQTNRSRNEIINILLDYAIDRCEVK